MKSIYIAGASSEMERAEKWMARCKEAGIKVVSNWPEVIKATGGVANPMDAPHEDRFKWSATDLEQVSESGALWLLLPEKPLFSTLELGVMSVANIDLEMLSGRYHLPTANIQTARESALNKIRDSQKQTIGAWIELGYALAIQNLEYLATGQSTRWVLCSGVERSIFTALADHYKTDEEAFAAITSSPEPKSP